MAKTNEVVTDTLALFEGLYEQLSKTFSKNASAAKETLSREIQIAQAKKERRKLIIELGEKAYSFAPENTNEELVQKIRIEEAKIKELTADD